MGIIAVPDLAKNAAGSITWWTIDSKTQLDKMLGVWLAHGFAEEDFIRPPTDRRALRRALRHFETAHVLVRKAPEGGFAVVEETFRGNTPEYEVLFHAWLDDDGPMVDVVNSEIEDRLDILFHREKNRVGLNEMSPWLIRYAYRHHAISLRANGGVYFIPKDMVRVWTRMATALHEGSGCHVYQIPALQSQSAVEAVLGAFSREVEADVGELDRILRDEQLGARALRTKAQDCENQLKKIEYYEKLLGVSLDKLRTSFEELSARVAGAIVALG